MNAYTVFCQGEGRTGSTYVTHVQADDLEEAKARGVAEGKVEVLFWDDGNDW